MPHPTSLDLSRFVRGDDLVLWGQAAGRPRLLTGLLAEQAASLGELRCFTGFHLGEADEPAPPWTTVSYTAMGNRAAQRAGRLEIVPVHYSDLAAALATGDFAVDVVLIQVTRPGPDGRHRLAYAADYVTAALRHARTVLAEVNPAAPLIPDAPVVEPERVAAWVSARSAPLETAIPETGPLERRIAARVAGFVEDGATLQVGLGKIPEAVAGRLTGRADLGIHTGALGDGLAALIESGAVTNRRKGSDAGRSVTGLVLGSRALYDFVDGHGEIALRPVGYTHDPAVLASLPRLTAINSAVEVDLTGAVNCEVAAGRYVGAVGGALDFARGARRSPGGVSIVALPSTAGAVSRIVGRLSGPATIGAADACVIVTEHGVADLRGRTMSERRDLITALAHPRHRAELDRSPHLPGAVTRAVAPREQEPA
ncbi:acetyl-CoA hydrolase/transferase C-terminal domain-containing protein [Amycolatopsis rhabdoformis]|uniref:Acetyl-CoA hydrolase/transferase C-terminal domain-containing protein n=1 Tax=Amycolatopsis rhabdoformis TaxID=1448059 RepID=A0ABZ1IDR1_9PSEU|nr:acetyl-CoA hydrolase/transferase C-terminal domain-containing protein [Amycolatopsis rhabdoformis]WSE32562.1 acetyl-CoA hydrolase/transferase C-terminal domain-containing protein [Amycolatopsis rhabdoformis]